MKATRVGPWGMGGLLLAASVAAAVDYDLSWHTIDGGGAMRTTGGPFELSATIGQPDAGGLSGGRFEITGGFWFGIVPGDCTEDGGVTRFDQGRFQDCATGPGVVQGHADCYCLDFDGDGDIDLADVAEFQLSVTAH